MGTLSSQGAGLMGLAGERGGLNPPVFSEGLRGLSNQEWRA